LSAVYSCIQFDTIRGELKIVKTRPSRWHKIHALQFLTSLSKTASGPTEQADELLYMQ